MPVLCHVWVFRLYMDDVVLLVVALRERRDGFVEGHLTRDHALDLRMRERTGLTAFDAR